jgi:hypothetical protein
MTTAEPGEMYWTMIEPHWKRVTIYEGATPFLRDYAHTPEAARNLLSAHWCQSEVCNGGLHQFFINPTGVLGVASFWEVKQGALRTVET